MYTLEFVNYNISIVRAIKNKNYSITPLWDRYAMDKKTLQSRVRLTINLKGNQIRITLKVRCSKADFDGAIFET
jgi:hypothetical protein